MVHRITFILLFGCLAQQSLRAAAESSPALVSEQTAELLSAFKVSDPGMPKTFQIGSGFQVVGDYVYVSKPRDATIQYFKFDPQASGSKFTYVGEVKHSKFNCGLSLCAAGGRLYAHGIYIWNYGMDAQPALYDVIIEYELEKGTGKPIEKEVLPGIGGGGLMVAPDEKNLYVPSRQGLTWVSLGADGKPSLSGYATGPGLGASAMISPDGKQIYSVGDHETNGLFRDHTLAIVDRKPTGEIVYRKAISLDGMSNANPPNTGDVAWYTGSLAGISPDGKWVYVALFGRDMSVKNCFGIFKRDLATGDLMLEKTGSEFDTDFASLSNLGGASLQFAADGTSGFLSGMGVLQNFRCDPATGALSDLSDVLVPDLKGVPGFMYFDPKRELLLGTFGWGYEPYGSFWPGVWAAKTKVGKVRGGGRVDLKYTAAAAPDAKPADTSDWPCWRGPNGDGKNPMKGIRKDWTGGLTKVWEVSGLSPFFVTWSAPSVQGDKIVVVGKHGNLDQVLCFNADKGGAPLWLAELPGGGGDGWSGGPTAQPYIAGDKVYVCHAASRYTCLSMTDGRVIWRKKFSSDGHSPGHPVLIWEDLAILTHVIRPENNKRSTLSAFNKDTGELVWSHGEDEKRVDLNWTGALSLKIDGKNQLVFNTCGFSYGLDPRTGKTLWELVPESVTKTDIGIYTDPLTDGKTVIVVSANVKNEHVRTAVQIENGIAKELWKTVVNFSGWTNAVLHDGYLYTYVADGLYSSFNSGFQCVDLKTGQEKWSEKKTGCGSVVEVDGCLLCLTYKGDLMLLDPSPAGFKKITEWKGAIKLDPWFTHVNSPANYGGAPCWTVPIVARGKLYVRYNNTLTCFDLIK